MDIEIPPDTTVRSLVETVVPELHARLVPDGGPQDAFTVNVRIEDAGDWTVRIAGREMRVVDGAADKPTLWLFTTARAVELFLEDATGPKRFLPRFDTTDGLALLSDPRLVKRAALASGRIELAMTDEGERIAIVLGFGSAARKRIDPDDADVVIETGAATIDRMLSGRLAPEEALADGDVRVRGNRMLAMQLALAVAPFYPKQPKPAR
jgi:putative sterol carrier protein